MQVVPAKKKILGEKESEKMLMTEDSQRYIYYFTVKW